MTTTLDKLTSLRELYIKLLQILVKEGNDEVVYAIRVLRRGISDLENGLLNSQDINLDNLFDNLFRDYKSMYPPRGGLTDFFIWRDNFEERVAANKPLDSIKDDIEHFFKVN
jgi:hypothetical protein